MNFSTYVKILDLYQEYGAKGKNMEIGCNVAQKDFVFYMSGKKNTNHAGNTFLVERNTFHAGDMFLVDGYNQYMLNIEGHPAELKQEFIYHPRSGNVEIKIAQEPNDSPAKAALRKHIQRKIHGKTNTHGR